MLKLKIKYNLNSHGLSAFDAWFKEAVKEAAQQPGFLSLSYEIMQGAPIAYLNFQNEDLLNQWVATPGHDELEAKLIQYYIAAPTVEIIE